MFQNPPRSIADYENIEEYIDVFIKRKVFFWIEELIKKNGSSETELLIPVLSYVFSACDHIGSFISSNMLPLDFEDNFKKRHYDDYGMFSTTIRRNLRNITSIFYLLGGQYIKFSTLLSDLGRNALIHDLFLGTKCYSIRTIRTPREFWGLKNVLVGFVLTEKEEYHLRVEKVPNILWHLMDDQTYDHKLELQEQVKMGNIKHLKVEPYSLIISINVPKFYKDLKQLVFKEIDWKQNSDEFKSLQKTNFWNCQEPVLRLICYEIYDLFKE